MNNVLRYTQRWSYSSGLAVLLVIYVVLALFAGAIAGIVVLLPFYGFDVEVVLSLSYALGDSGNKFSLLAIQGFSSFFGFILAPLVFIRNHLDNSKFDFLVFPRPLLQPIFMTVVVVFCFMAVNSAFIEWNQNLEFPEFLSGFEHWAQEKETEMRLLTEYLTTFDSFGYYLLTLVIIAVFPAVGEELLFRGLFQNILWKAFKNPHVAIWLSATFFSAFHLQFFGFVPRLLLGALFGYIYLWSGSLPLAMLAHFVNNAFSLTMVYLTQQHILELSQEDLEKSLPYYGILIFLAAGSGLLYLFRKYFVTHNE